MKATMIGKHRGMRIVLMMLISMALLAAGCGNTNSKGIVEGKVNVVTSFYPLYFLVNEIGGDSVNTINLIPAGIEPHDWTPKSQDIQNASQAQLLIVQGAGFEGWLDDFKKGLDAGSNVKITEASKGISLITATGDEHEHEGEAHQHEEAEAGHEGHDHASHDHGGTDPHTWVSPKSALIMAQNVKDALIQANASHKAEYEQRYDTLHKKLVELDHKYDDSLKNLKNREMVVSHQAFGYLCRDYNLTQHAIMGVSPDAEPRAQDLVKLSKLVKDEGIKYIFFEELVSDQLAKTLADETGVETLVLSPLEGLTQEQEKAGDNYITLMERNLQNLLQALQ
ncbi:zinc ABC transporter substrate-binding protein [Paenibacillus sp. ACRRX]|uniref:metal ABC transporter solute-binding protein, Zn/Mn family n=1 Tax=unclassified Paenibacillus TaxID=185978 RepID=UPI001EF6318A|nr:MULTISPECIES: zinc ABC transporter substrate-binding protein [unclassified Paenibacillus]MCG7406277.1 zinc ABC transporter substrate-binding protein [Paenibacillus sp. ACRRX]MDK8179310.1 zinc ABC transporter substrate-binding protein [Paenibacillus sp. UMB4589-SE434]